MPCAATTRSRPHGLYVNLAVYCDYSSPGRTRSTSTLPCTVTTRHSATSSTSTSPCAATTRLRPHVLYLNLAVRRDYSSPAARALRQPCRAPRLLVTRPHMLYVDLVVHREYSSPLSRLQRSTSTTPGVRVPRHVARLIVDYSASPRLVVDYSTARPGASARRAAHHVASRAARCRLLHVAQSCRRLLRVPRLRLAATLALLQPRRGARLLALRQHWLYFEYVTRRHDVVFWSHRVDHSSRLVFQTSRERQSRPQQLVGINSD
jgi:hypothetical protein